MLRPDFPLSTARLVLRPFTAEDVDDVWAYQRQPGVARHLLWEARDREQSRIAVQQMMLEDALLRDGDCLTLAAVCPDSGTVVGQVELVWLSSEHRQGELGYIFNPDHQGRGLATEAARAMLRLGFGELGLHRIVGRCVARNTASAALMERLGMRREAHFLGSAFIKGEWRDEYVYALLASDFYAHLDA